MMRTRAEILGNNYGNNGEFKYSTTKTFEPQECMSKHNNGQHKNMRRGITIKKSNKVSESEKVILRNIAETCKNGWIARDKNNCLYIYSIKPKKLGEIWVDGTDMFEGTYTFDRFNDLFKCVRWSDKKPTYIPDLLEDK